MDILSDIRYARALWERSPIPKAITDAEGRFLHINPKWTSMLGYSKSELVGQHFSSITHPADIHDDETEVQALRESIEAGGYSMVKRYIDKRGSSVWVELHVSTIRRPDGTLEALVATAIPLPDTGNFKIEQNGNSVAVRPSLRWIDLVRDNPRETLLVVVIVFAAAGRIPFETLTSMVMHMLGAGK